MPIIIMIILFISIVESIYCYAMKIHDHKQLFLENSSSFEYNMPKIKIKKHAILAKLLKFANDFTFLFAKITGYVPSHFIRMLIYRYILHMKIAPKVVIYYGLEVRSPWNLIIGEGTIIGDKAILDARYGINIGKHVNISTGVWIWTAQHDVNSPTFSTEGKEGKVIIGDRAWLSSRSTILPNCKIGEGCVLAAGGIVTKDCNELFTIYGGLPAKEIGHRNSDVDYVFTGNHRYFL